VKAKGERRKAKVKNGVNRLRLGFGGQRAKRQKTKAIHDGIREEDKS
jgi:hypothetical protein